MTAINKHEGKKYLRTIKGWKLTDTDQPMTPGDLQVDAYAIIKACNITCPAQAHAVKKVLFAGTRSKGDKLVDLEGAIAALHRAIELERDRLDGPQRGEPIVAGFEPPYHKPVKKFDTEANHEDGT